MEKLVILLLGILLAIIGISTFIIFENMPGSPQELIITNPPEPPIKTTSLVKISQFYEGIRFNHNNISYSFSPDCPQETIDKVLEAFQIISTQTEVITFYEDRNSDIDISCSEQSIQKATNVFIAGEGGPSEFINTTEYPVILHGEILLYRKSQCQKPIVALHELLHVFGFDHSNDSSSVMYPYSECDQTLSQDYTDFLKQLYSIPAKGDIYFENVSATKSGRYLDFNITIINNGIIDVKNVSLSVLENNEEIKSFYLGDIAYGLVKKSFNVQNLKLSSRSSSTIELILKTDTPEYNKENNRVVASVS